VPIANPVDAASMHRPVDDADACSYFMIRTVAVAEIPLRFYAFVSGALSGLRVGGSHAPCRPATAVTERHDPKRESRDAPNHSP
jgi:hypothetical protein